MPTRKRTLRHSLRLPVTFWPLGDRGSDRTSGHMLNVSNGGLYVATYQPLAENTPVELRIECAGRVVRTWGRVVHEASIQAEDESMFSSGMGVRFSQPEDSGVIELVRQGHPLLDDGGRRRLPR